MLTVVLDRIEGEIAVLVLEDKQELLVPVSELPEDATEGQVFKLILKSDTQLTSEHEASAKAVLNEIFNGAE